MSFWLKLGLSITDLEMFKNSCDQHGIEYEECQDKNFKMRGHQVHAYLRDTKGTSYREAYLVKADGGFKMMVDNDPHYSSITKRLGKNGGKLTRDYATGVVRKNVQKAGGMIQSTKELSDGSIVIKAQAM